MKNNRHKKALLRSTGLILTVLMLVLQVVALPTNASAAQITTRSLTLQAGASDGGSKPGGVVNHLFTVTIPSGASVGSIKFEYCTTAADVGVATCVAPTGMTAVNATLASESGATGFSGITKTVNSIVINRTSASVIPVNTIASYQFSLVTNPTDINTTFFTRITTHASLDGTGAILDSGTVATSTAEPIILSGIMPESLVFCTGETVGLDIATSTVPDCSTATSGIIEFNQLFSPTDTATATSQMAASTNAGFGYIITVNGPTLTSGLNTIAGMGTAGVGVPGTAQFGLNLKANTVATSTVPVGIEVAPVPNASNYRGIASVGYNTVDTFKFTSGDTVAASNDGGAGASDAQIFTVSYIGNVPGSQPAGTYTTTLTYICTPTF